MVMKAKKLARAASRTDAEYEEQLKVIDAMGPLHYVRYMEGNAEDGIDFLDVAEHAGEEWRYNESTQSFEKI